MIEWDSPTWGGGVTYAANGSWVADRHDDPDKVQQYSTPDRQSSSWTVRGSEAAGRDTPPSPT